MKQHLRSICVLALSLITAWQSPSHGQALSGGGGGVGSNPSFMVNAAPTVVSSNQQNTGSGVTSIAVPAPASIVNGNALVLAVNVLNVTAETWTPPAGFAQIGSTAAQTASHKLVQAAFCKVASSEAGSYTISWNNSGNAQGVIYQLSGTNCSPVAQTAITGNANTLTQTAFAASAPNDLIVIFAGQGNNTGAGSHVIGVSPGTMTKGPEQSFSTVLAGFTLSNGAGNTPSAVFDFVNAAQTSLISDDSIVQAFDFSGTSTAANSVVTNGAPANLSALNLSGPLDITGTARASGSFLLPNGVLANGSTTASLAAQTTKGLAVPLLGLNASNNVNFDPSETASYISFGSGTHANALDIALFQPSGAQWVSQDNSQDLILFASDASNNLKFGNANTAGSNEENDMYFQVQTGKTFHLNVNNADVATQTNTALVELAGAVVQVTPEPLATYPACAAGTEGAMATQTNSTAACSAGTTATSAGSTHCQIYCNGTNWIQTGR